MRLLLKSKRFTWDISFSGKYSIIAGDSGTGKTNFYRAAASCINGNKALKLASEYPLVVLDRKDAELPDCKEHIILIDENCKILTEERLPTILKESNNYFVIITRKKLDFLQVSIDNYYQMVQNGKTYQLTTLYPRFNYKNDISNPVNQPMKIF